MNNRIKINFKKNVIQIILSLMLILGFSVSKTYKVHAFNSGKYSIVVENGKEYVSDLEGNLSVFYDGYGNEITADKAIQLLNELEDVKNQSTIATVNQVRGVVYPYVNEVHYQNKTPQYSGTRVKVSPDAQGPTNIGYIETVSTSESFGGSINITAAIKLKIVAAVEAGLDIVWDKTTTSSSSFTIDAYVPSGKIGAIYFTPYLIRYNCVYYNYDGSAFSVYGVEPQKTGGGFTDGLYQLILR